MISPCRIHRTRNRVDPLAFALLFAACLLDPVTEAMAQYAAGSSETAGVSGGRSVPLEITAGVDIGYDDHVLGSNTTTGSSGQSSFFARENIVLSYDRPRERSELRLIAVGRFAQFFDVGTDDKDGTVTLALTHNFSTRLSFRADVYAAYQTEPNFQSNVGPENVRAPHFDTSDVLSVTYHWFPRFAMVTSYTFRSVQYESSSSSVGTSQNRVDNTLGEALRFSLTKRTELIGEYRFQTINYETATNNSITHYVLVGVDHHLTEHLRFDARGGPSFRSLENDGNTVNPYFEGRLAYTSSNHSLDWTTSYGYESPTAANVSNRTTIRTGVNLTYNLTSRLHSTTGLYYHHNENQGQSGTSSAGSQDGLQFTLGLKYTINKRFALHVDYQYTAVSSSGATAGYSRNHYFGGLTYTY